MKALVSGVFDRRIEVGDEFLISTCLAVSVTKLCIRSTLSTTIARYFAVARCVAMFRGALLCRDSSRCLAVLRCVAILRDVSRSFAMSRGPSRRLVRLRGPSRSFAMPRSFATSQSMPALGWVSLFVCSIFSALRKYISNKAADTFIIYFTAFWF